jgi:uncharacterized protein
VEGEGPHLPRPAPIEAYGSGGFRFAGMSHRGSLLCLPDGVWASPAEAPGDISEATLARVIAATPRIELLLIGAGRASFVLPAALRARLRGLAISHETMSTGAAISTYNILLGEGRRIAALLLAVE